MSQEQAQKYLVELYGYFMVRETMWKNLAKEQWGIEAPSRQLPTSEGDNDD